MKQKYQVLLYYHYVAIDDPDAFRDAHRQLCESLGLLGRVLVAHEGINGTLSGTAAQTQAYMDAVHADPRFATMPFKIDEADGHAFKKLKVRVRPELVNLSLEDDVNPLELTGKHLKPTEFFEAMQTEDTVVVDARNDYEYDLGHFRGAVRPDIRNFRELPEWIRNNREVLEGKKILTYCTGGVRCEKFSGWLLKEGFADVSQLDGGIATYGRDEQVKGDLWDGMMYVFDERISVPVNRVEHHVVGRDYYTGEPCERYVNCANPSCNRQMLCSEANEAHYMRSCSDSCRRVFNNRFVKEQGWSQDQVETRIQLLNSEK